MSLEGSDVVQQKKDHTEVVHWNEYEALRDVMYIPINKAVEPLDVELQCVGLAVDGAVCHGRGDLHTSDNFTNFH